MPEPTPTLSAEELAALTSLAAKAEHSATMHPSLLRAALATIAARDAEIATLKADAFDLVAVIGKHRAEGARLREALESIVSIGRLANYVEFLQAGEEIHFSDELRELAVKVLARKEATDA